MTSKFERKRRIVKTDEFSSVFRFRPVVKTEHFVMYARANFLPHARLGVVVGKRFAARSVTRNAVKRAVREGFRQSTLLAAMGLDCVVRLSKPLASKTDPACTDNMQAVLFNEVKRLFANHSKLTKLLEIGDQSQTSEGEKGNP